MSTGTLRGRHVAFAAVVASIASLLIGPGAASAASPDTSPPELVDVTLSTDAVSVSGLKFRRVTVSVHLTDDTGVR